jgi:hypothetical protein
MADTERRAPVQGFSQGIPWSIHARARDAYSAKYGASQSAEGIAEHGGFATGELDVFAPGWREEVSEIARLRAQLDAETGLRQATEKALGDTAAERDAAEHNDDKGETPMKKVTLMAVEPDVRFSLAVFLEGKKYLYCTLATDERRCGNWCAWFDVRKCGGRGDFVTCKGEPIAKVVDAPKKEKQDELLAEAEDEDGSDEDATYEWVNKLADARIDAENYKRASERYQEAFERLRQAQDAPRVVALRVVREKIGMLTFGEFAGDRATYVDRGEVLAILDAEIGAAAENALPDVGAMGIGHD